MGAKLVELVESIDDIRANIKTLDKYLNEKREPEYSYALDLVHKGRCFAAVKSENGYKFYPSRFIGYIDNTMDKHENNENRDGKETNPAISAVLHSPLSFDLELELSYEEYCKKLGFDVYRYKRKYWRLP